ncbi:MAG: DNA primase [Rhodospirillales bacterium]|jgi:DNA primase
MAFSPRFLDEVKNRIGLAEVVGRRVRLIKKGREHSGLCPFHNEKTPSFTVNEDKGFYHCFGCGEHGSVFDFVMKTDNLSFPEAVERLANEAGMEIPVETPEERQRQERAKGLYEVIEAATVYFEKLLRMPEGKAALDYLLNRGISEASIKHFRIGFAADNRGGLKAALSRQGISDQLMIEAGLLIQPDDPSREPYDRFRGRVIFPITDRRGRMIAFGGRILGDGEPKYLNSPETPLFHKGFNLYAMSQSIDSIRKSNFIIVCEGYTDVISMHQAGFSQTVAPLGTALTEDQLKVMWRISKNIYLCFDGDTAGQKAMNRVVDRALPIFEEGQQLSFMLLPKGEDPDELIKKYGNEFIQKLLNEALPLSKWLWNRVKTANYLTHQERSATENNIRTSLQPIKNQNVRNTLQNELTSQLWDYLKKKSASTKNQKTTKKREQINTQLEMKSGVSAQIDAIWIQQAILVGTIINHPDLFDALGEQLGSLEFKAPELDKLRQEVLNTLASSPGLDFQALQDHLNTTGFSELMNGLLSRQVINHANFARPDEHTDVTRKGWEQTLRLFRRNQLLEEIRVVEEELAENPTQEAFELLKALKQTATQKEDAEEYLSNFDSAKSA